MTQHWRTSHFANQNTMLLECPSAGDSGDNIWDQPCFVNEDCPFFNENGGGRGGCGAGGVCEVPVGVKRIGFRKHDAKGIYAPFCYGCGEDAASAQCCENQDPPDYVFPGDYEARAEGGRDTDMGLS